MIPFLGAVPLTSDTGLAQIASTVTIRRDRYGVPHITAPTDAGAVFGLMYAQAEDNFPQLERDTIYAIGRATEIDGEKGLANDIRVRSFEVPRLAREMLARTTAKHRKIAQAYADGLNYYLRTHPKVKPHLLTTFEPWYFIANIDLPSAVDGISVVAHEMRAETEATDPGSNAWAIAGSRTTSGHAVLFSNPHVGLFGAGQRYECHVTSGEGWNVAGFAILGNPIPHAGHNEHLGWSHTNTGADSADSYREEVKGETYRVGAEFKPIREWSETFSIRSGDQTETREINLRATERGPLVESKGEHFSLRFPVAQALQWWEQKLAMGKARTFDEFKKALAIASLTGSNTTYADQAGHIAFWYGNAVPKRDPRFDWSRPVDGTDPDTEWLGFLSPDELPHVVDPPSGYVQNCNSDPWHTTSHGNPLPSDSPAYVVHDIDTSRAQNSRRILHGETKFTWEQLEGLAFDTYVLTAAQRLPDLFAEAAKDPYLATKLAEPLDALRHWDYRSSSTSVPSTLYFEMELDLLEQKIGWRRQLAGTPRQMLEALDRSVSRLLASFGSWRVHWGHVNRMQRISIGEKFPINGPIFPVDGAPSVFGQIFAFGYPFHAGGIHYGTEGNTFVSLVEFANEPKAASVCGFGQSADPSSPHFLDQMELYATGKFKPAWFSEEEIKANLEKSYHPGK